MIKILLSTLLAVNLTPFYHYNYNEPLQESAYYAMSYIYEEDRFSLSEITDFEPVIENYVFVLYLEELAVSNYYFSIAGDITFNPEFVADFGAATLQLKFGDSVIFAATFAVSLFSFQNEQFGFGYNVRINSSEWSPTISSKGYSIRFSEEQDEIEQNSLYLDFYAYEQNIGHQLENENENGYNKGLQVGEEIGYNSGYNAGFLDGQQNNFGIEGFFRSVFNVIDNVGQIELFPNIKLWYIILIPLIFGVLSFVIGLFR